jgi:CRISPR-associated protein Cas5t
MSEKTIFIEIFQPFAQFRNPFTFYYAQTYPLPPKSTIIGMLQNAVEDWYGNMFGIEKWWDLKVSVHGGFESIFWNYQQLIKGEIFFDEHLRLVNQDLPLYGEGLKSQRSPIYQQELFNGHLYIMIRGEDSIISEVKEAFEKPKKVLYLGRSEDVIFIKRVEEVITEKDYIQTDLELSYPTYILIDQLPIKNKKYPVYSIPTKVIFKNGERIVKHKAEITKSTLRQVEFKTVIYTGYDYWLAFNTQNKVSVDIYKIDDKKEIKILDPYGWL